MIQHDALELKLVFEFLLFLAAFGAGFEIRQWHQERRRRRERMKPFDKGSGRRKRP